MSAALRTIGVLLAGFSVAFCVGYLEARRYWRAKADYWFSRTLRAEGDLWLGRIVQGRPPRFDLHPFHHATRYARVDELMPSVVEGE